MIVNYSKINSEKLLKGFLLSLLILTILIRFIGLTKSPPGIFNDEASFGYNAYSISETLRDEHGYFMPVFFRAMNDYKNPIQVYAMVPVVKLLGLNLFSVRFTSALFGFGSILLFMYFIWITRKNLNYVLAGGIVLSTIPWHFIFSRIGFEAMSFVFFIILSLVLFTKFIKTKNDWYLLFFYLSMIICFFSYSTARLMIPLSALGIAVLWRKELFTKRNRFLILFLNILIFLLIIMYDRVVNPVGILKRVGNISISNFSPSTWDTIKYFVGNYINHFSPQFLFQSGDYNLRHSTGISSMLLSVTLFPLIWGLAYFIKQVKKSKFAQFMLFMIITFPLASSLTIIEKGGHSIRTIHIVPFLAILILVGLEGMFKVLKGRHKIVLAVFTLFFLAELSFFYCDYFFKYPARAAGYYNYGLPEAVQVMLNKNYSYYYVSQGISNYGIEMPFFLKYDPAQYQKDKVIPNIRYIRSDQFANPLPGSVAIYKSTDNINHFPNEKLIHTSFYTERVVKKDKETGKDYYDYENRDMYYVYEYQ